MVSTVVLGAICLPMVIAVAVTANRLDEARDEVEKLKNDLREATEDLDVLYAEKALLRDQVNSDSLVRALRERVSVLLDENSTLRAQAEQNDEARTAKPQRDAWHYLTEDGIEQMADRHDSIGTVLPSGNVEGA